MDVLYSNEKMDALFLKCEKVSTITWGEENIRWFTNQYISKNSLTITDVRRLLGYYEIDGRSYSSWQESPPEICFDRWDLYVEDGTANNTLKISQNRKCKSKAQHDGRIKKSPWRETCWWWDNIRQRRWQNRRNVKKLRKVKIWLGIVLKKNSWNMERGLQRLMSLIQVRSCTLVDMLMGTRNTIRGKR